MTTPFSGSPVPGRGRDRGQEEANAISELVQEAKRGIHWSDKYGLKIWLNSTYTLRHRSLELEQSGELEKSYVLLVRAATLLLEYIPKHPEFDRTLNVQERGQLVQTGQGYLRDLARLKKVLEDQARLGVPVQRPVKSVDQAAEQQKNTFSQHPTPPSFGDLRRLGSPQTSQSRSHERRSSTQALPNTQYSSQPKASKRPDGEVEWDDGIPRRGQADEHRWEGGAYEDRGRGRERSGSGGIGTGGHQAELANYLTKMRLSPAPSLTSLGPSHGSDTQGLSHGDRPGSRAASSQDLTTPYLPSSGRFPSPTQAPTNHPAQQHQHPQYLLPNPSGYYSSTPPPIAPTYYRHPSPNQPPSSHTQQHAPLPYPYPSSSEHPSFSERMPTHIPKSASTSHLNIEYPSMPDPKDYQPMRDGYVPSFTNRAVVEQEGYGGYPSAGTGSGPGSGSGSGSHQYDAVPGPSTATRPVPPHSAWHEYYDYPHPGHHHLSPSPSEPAIDRLPLGLGMPLPVVVVNKPKGRPPEAPGRPSSSTSTSTPTSTTLQPTRPLHKPSSGLRRMRVPKSLLPSFLHIAYPNTKKKIETCGLLLGTVQVRYGAVQELVVEVLLIPKQKGTSDTCQMEEEEGVVTVQLEKGLDALGWIHTHPTQSCFMSSMDLHTHAAYQKTLPEAIAIVCAPKSKPDYGIFRLTEPGGLEAIMKCHNQGFFHEHPSVKGGIYTDADYGHVRLREAPLEIIDLRKNGRRW